LSVDFKKAKSLKEFPREIPNGFSNGFKRTRNLPLGFFLGTCLPVVKTWYIPECRKCYAAHFGIGRLEERVRSIRKKLQRRFFGNEVLKALDKQRESNGFKRTRILPLGSFLGTCLPVVKT
jgi:hypothetical protein